MAIRNTPANEPAVASEEPGAVDNRISWTPSDFPATEEWEDGQTYDLSELGDGVKLRQISPGEGELIPPVGAEDESAQEKAEPQMMKRGMKSAMPPVEDMAA